MLKYTKNNLKKIEQLFEQLDYTVRYERGSFQSGYCLVENRRVAVINKYFDTEGRINVLLDILQAVAVDEDALDEKTGKFYRTLLSNANAEDQ